MTLRKKAILIFSILNLTGCGETPTSQLSEQFPIIRSGPHNMEFAFIPKGTFRMGSPGDEEGRYENERQYWVKLTEDYWMQTTEVTRGQWYKVMFSSPDCWWSMKVIESDIHPVTCVDRYEAEEFIDKLNEQQKNSGYKYSLPTEAQWEYAARAYTETPYSIKGPVDSFAWHNSNSGKHTHPVGKLKANFFGLYDVHGNVEEWVADYLHDYPKADSFSEAIKNPDGPNNATYYVRRGGSWAGDDIRSACRNGSKYNVRDVNLGFRIVRAKI